MAGIELPYRAEYAKSGRAACRGCKEKIEKDHLRLAVMVQSPMFDGKTPNWYHFSCFFRKQRPKSVGDFSHFESLRWDDQEKIKKQIDGGAGASSSSASSSVNGKSGKATKRKSTKKAVSSGEFRVEYSKSSRAECRGCEEKIIKGDLRACIVDYDSDEGRRYGGVPLWHHLDCFVKVRHELEFWSSGDKLPGIKALSKEDQAKVTAALPAIKPVKKEEPDEEPVKKPKVEDNNIVKKQNQKMYKYRDYLKTLPKKELIELLEENEQEVPPGTENILDRLSDAMTFGALKRCPKCKHGQLVFRSGVGYYCLGQDEWAKCDSVFDDPARKAFVVPEDLKEEYDFLNKYKCKIEKRVFEKNAPSASTIAKSNLTLAKSMKSEPGKSGPKIDRHLPLRRMEFFISGKTGQEKQDIKHEIQKLGGTVGTKIHDKTTAVISTEEHAKKKGAHVKSAEDLNIQIVPLSFLKECEKGADAVATINRMNLVTWGSDPSTRLSAEVPVTKSSSKSQSKYKSAAGTVKLRIQGGVAVDPQSDLETRAHVYRDPRGNIYNASLSLTDLQTGKNSYYKLQVLESNTSNRYWHFRSWGRIGTTIGGFKVEDFTREEAIDQFKRLFLERTGNDWDNRKYFTKVPGKMVMVDVSYDDDEVDGNVVDVPSKLEKPVQEIIKLIFNIDIMKNVMKEMELDLEKMPLGKLSKKQIQEAFKVLTRLQDYIKNQGEEIEQRTVISCTNQFFSLIPHDFGIENPPLLDDLDVIKQKTEMLDSLMEIEIAYSLLKKSDEDGGAVSRIDSHYKNLKAKIHPMSATEPEFETLKLYVKNTHAETHQNYKLKVLEIFKVDRHGEDERFNPFRKLHNRKLLWHGSRVTNFAGILSQGLRIAPPEAPVTGYMFGKGIYFADMVSKSANYCMANPSNKTGLLLLCEVALGDMHELYHAEMIVKPPKGKHSVKGVGKTHPNPTMTKMLDDGVEIPLGPGVPSPHNNTSLLYNEYIVYDVAQVKVRYLVQVEFDFTY